MWLTKLSTVFCKPQSRSITQVKKTIYDYFLHCRSSLESVCSSTWRCWEQYSKNVAHKLPILFSHHLHPYQSRITWTTWQEWKHKLRIVFKIPSQSSNISDFTHYNWMKRGWYCHMKASFSNPAPVMLTNKCLSQGAGRKLAAMPQDVQGQSLP